jgi:hypothetical protein
MADWQFGQASWGGDPKDGRDIFFSFNGGQDSSSLIFV